MVSLNEIEIVKWISDRGDYTHNITYDINENSTIMDFGGYTGIWAQQIIDKYNPNVYIIEPIPEYFNILVNKFKNNPKVKILNVGVSVRDEEKTIYLNNDGSSTNFYSSKSTTVSMKSLESILESFGLKQVNLIQINIEGDEYALLENMIETKTIEKFDNIQIQFHLGIENYIERRESIRKNLVRMGYKINFEYPFVWESWRKNDI